MTAMTDFTSYDSIRAVLGVAIEEIPDATCGNVIYLTQLTERLLAINSTLTADYIALLPGPPVAATDLRFFNLVQTYAAYYVAGRMVGSLPLFAAKTIADQQETAERVVNPFDGLKDDIDFTIGSLLTLLGDAYAAVKSTTAAAVTPRVLVVSTGLALDPVTNT